MFLLVLTMGSFSLTSATLPMHTEPEPEPIKSDSTLTEDLSEYCKPDWSGYDTLSPDISTRRFLYPNGKKLTKKVEKQAKRDVDAVQ